jgi:NADH-quinone oxidoreductase subunit I
MYKELDKRAQIVTNKDKFGQFLRRSFKFELFVGLWVVLREMFKKNNTHTIKYPFEKYELSPRYRGVHSLKRLLESGEERCIGCGLCEKICVSNCIAMDTKLGEDGRKKVASYSINLGRCVYCGLCADVCPEIAITHGGEYEFASDQRAYFGLKEDFLTKDLRSQSEFGGYGSLSNLSDELVKQTPLAYNKDDEKKDENV